MTPADIETYARAKYNASGDSFFTSAEIQYYIYQFELELFTKCPNAFEFTPVTTTVVQGTRTYNYPTSCRVIKRIEYTISGGSSFKLEPITFREDDALTLVNVASTTQGKPQFYEIFNNQIYLRPIPDNSVDTFKVFFFGEPLPVTSGVQVLELASLHHMDAVDFVVKEMYAKDKDPTMYELFDTKWKEAKIRIQQFYRKNKRGDAFTVVMDEDNLAVTLTGPV